MPANRSANVPKRILDRRLVLGAFLIVLLIFGGMILRKFLTLTPPPQPLVAQVETPRQLREIILYFATPDGTRLVAEGREIEDCLVEEDCLRETVQSLLNGPVGELEPILPTQTVLHNLTVNGSVVTLDFNQALIAGHPGGTQSELLTVYGLVDTLAANFPHLRQLVILVEGQPVATLKGHVDLHQPVSADFSLVEEGDAPTGDMRKLGAGGTE